MGLILEERTREIIGACMDVSNELGCGFLESVYEKALVIALEERGLKVQHQVPLSVNFRGHSVGSFIADIVVDDAVIIELKAVKVLLPEHKAQVLNYHKATGKRVGILANFGKPKFDWIRLVY
jgi:GxxExxY protein